MSLIYDALRQQGAVAAATTAAPRGNWWARQPASTRNLVMMMGGLVVGVPLALLALSRPTPMDERGAATAVPAAVAADASSTPVQAGVAAVDTAPQSALLAMATSAPAVPRPEAGANGAAPASGILAQGDGSQAQHGVASRSSAALAAIAGRPAASTLDAAPVLAEQQTPSSPPLNIQVRQREPGPASSHATAVAAVDDQTVQAAITAVERAMAADDTQAAGTALVRLEALLPKESLTLLRTQAWVAHASNDMQAAEQLYRQIIERMPDDANAGVNVALLDARRGEVDNARKRLQRLSGLYPRSTQVSRALSELDAAAR